MLHVHALGSSDVALKHKRSHPSDVILVIITIVITIKTNDDMLLCIVSGD